VQRDVEYLRRRGAPIRWNAGRKGYEYTDLSYVPDFEPRLTEGDLLSILAAESVLPHYRGTPYEGILRRTFLKAGKAFGTPLKIKMKDLVSHLPRDATPKHKGEVDKLPRKTPDEDGPIPVILRFSPSATPQVLSLDWPEDFQLQSLMDGGLEVTFETHDADEILRWALQWGTDVELISPRWARRRLLQIIEMVRNQYKPVPVRGRRKVKGAVSVARRRARSRVPAQKGD
jgi:predicted DNA-binding transcriptional regulator YafY